MGRLSGVFLLVEPDPEASEVMASAIQEFGRAHVVKQVDDADAWLSATGVATGIVVNVAAGGQNAVEWLTRVRPRLAMTPLLCLVDDPAAVSDLANLRSEQLRLPCSVRELRGFARRALAFGRVRAARLSWFVEYAGRRAALSTSSTELLVEAVAAAAPGQLATDLGTTHSTLEAQIRNLVSERSDETLLGRADELLLRLLRDDPPCDFGPGLVLEREDATAPTDRPPESLQHSDLSPLQQWKRVVRH
jgi:hypothetical protein